MRKFIYFFPLLFFSFPSILLAQKKTEIIWDNYGVPHIYADNEKEMFYAFGWSQMQNHANLLLELFAQARGRASEYIGQQFLPSDKQIHLFNIPDSAASHYNKYRGNDKIYLDAFVKGMNDYADVHSDKVDNVLKAILPIQPTDIIAHEIRILCLEFLGRSDIYYSSMELSKGSNAYAIAPSKSASKNAMLVINPHMMWSDYSLFFEAHLTAPGINIYGASLVGQYNLIFGFNEHLGWTHTVNTIDAADTYVLTLQDGGYLLDGKTTSFDKKTVTFKVKQKDGSFIQQEIEFKYSKHGPVVGEKNNTAHAIRIVGTGNAYFATQYHKMSKAKNFNEFESALKMMQNPMLNVIYADKEGNSFYLFNGNIPKRSEGDWAFWQGKVDGTKSKYIWNENHPYTDLPRILNPETGFIQNANDPPWLATYPSKLDPQNFPPYLSPVEMPLRPQRSINMIKDDASITFEELVAYKLNTGMEAADRFLDDLLEAIKLHPDTTAERASLILQKWDKATDVDSRGAVLFARWLNKLTDSMYAIPWDPAHPVTTPDGLNNPKQAVQLLIAAAKETEKQYGSLDVKWGDVYRFKMGEHDYPANGGSGYHGVFRTMHYSYNKQTNKNYAIFGDTFVAVIEFGKKIKAEVLLSYGNATQPGSKYIGDQLKLLSEKKLRPALLMKKDVEKNADKREVLSIDNL